ncbi:MAG: hypothetical protein ACFFBD_06580 [Candidatus Hodarchaeota archaeon]
MPGNEKEKSSGKSGNITISTTFTGEHAKLITKLEEEYQCTRPTALRLFFNKFISGLLITLNPNTKERISRIITNPVIKDQYGFFNAESFVEFAVNETIKRISQALGDLKDPTVQSMLDRDEIEVARQMLLLARDIDNYGGVSIEKLTEITNKDMGLVKRIVEYFVSNGWVIQTALGGYLPIDRPSFDSLDS